MREREQKLIAGRDAQLPRPEALLAGLGGWALEEIEQDAVYFDTSDLRLTRAGVSLRFRSDDGWTVKLPESHEGRTFVRQEHGFTGERGEPPVAAVELVRAWARSSPLEQVAQIRTHRRKLHVSDACGREIGEIDDDDVTATVTRRPTTRFREIEVEMKEGVEPRLVETLVKRLRKAGVGNGRSMPKIARALGEPALAPPDLVPPTDVNRGSTLGELVRSTISRSTQRLVDHDPVIRLSEDPDGIHEARVATRRLRSDLQTFRPVLDAGWSEPLRAELRWLGEQLGRVRDADVLLGLLEAKADEPGPERPEGAAELIDRLREVRARERDVLIDAMRSDRYSALLDRLVDAARAPRLRSGMEHRRAAESVGKLVRRPWKRLRRRVKQLPAVPTNTDLHTIRKRAKQARYALEATAPVAGGHAKRTAKRTAKRLATIQDVLGDHQDAVVAAEWLGHAAQDSNGAAVPFTAGVLTCSFDADRRRLRRRWKRAWKRARRSGVAGVSS